MRFPSFNRTISTAWHWVGNTITAHSLLAGLGLSLGSGLLAFAYAMWGLVSGLSPPIAGLVAFAMFFLAFFFVVWAVGFYANFDELGWGMVSLTTASQLVNYRARDTQYIKSARAQAAFEDNQSATNRVAANMAKNLPIFGKIDDSEHFEEIPKDKTRGGRILDDGYRLLYRYDKATYRYNDLQVRKRDLRDFLKKAKRGELDG